MDLIQYHKNKSNSVLKLLFTLYYTIFLHSQVLKESYKKGDKKSSEPNQETKTSPVISLGIPIPINERIVGARSASLPFFILC